MPLFERPPLETLAPAKDRWPPLYLEHGQIEGGDSSVKWIGGDGFLCRIPVVTVSIGGGHEIYQGDKQGQEVNEGCKRLIKNAVVCWNYLFLTQKIAEHEDRATRQA